MGLGAAGLGLGLLLPLASLPWFAVGYWDKAEPIIIGFHLASALCTLAVLTAWIQAPTIVSPRVTHPYVLLPLALGLWSVVVAPLTPVPWLSISGVPQSGLGALWFLDSAALIACALLLVRHNHLWRGLTIIALSMVLITALVKAADWQSLHNGGLPALIFVAAYYGWLALPLPLLAWRTDSPKRHHQILAVILGLIIATASQTWTAPALVVITALALFIPAHRLPPRLGLAAVVVAALTPWIVLHGIPQVQRMASLRDRMEIQQLVQAALINDPAWIIGHGWGRTQEAFHIWMNQVHEQLWNPTWPFLTSDYFHSHNWQIESLYAAGIPGMVLMLAGFLSIPHHARPACRVPATAFALCVALFSGLWFPLSLWLPLAAMGLACIADQTNWHPRLPRSAAIILLAILASAQMAMAYQQWDLAHSITLARRDAAPWPQDFRGSDLEVAEAIRADADMLAHQPPQPTKVLTRLHAIEQRAEQTHTLQVLEVGLDIMARIHLSGDLAFAAAPGQETLWRHWLDLALRMAPQRNDLAVPLLTAMIAQNQLLPAAELATRLRRTNPHDPVGLHYSGLILMLAPDADTQDQGRHLLQQAISNGIERYIPLDFALKNQLGTP